MCTSHCSWTTATVPQLHQTTTLQELCQLPTMALRHAAREAGCESQLHLCKPGLAAVCLDRGRLTTQDGTFPYGPSMLSQS
jgi:hypothetical protein